MDIIRAKEIIHALANGVDPSTGELLPDESVYNAPDVIRALFTLLSQVDENEKKTSADPLCNAGKLWSEAEDAALRNEFLSKLKISDIAKQHGRTYGSIESRLDYLGLKKKSFWFFKKKQP